MKARKTAVTRQPRWRKNKFGGESCFIRGIGLHLDTTSDKKFKLRYGWEVELGDAYEYGRAATLNEAKYQAKICALRLLADTNRAVNTLWNNTILEGS